MNPSRLLVCVVISLSAAAAQENRAGLVVPQPRLRLDPTTRAAVPATPQKAAQPEAFDAAVVMSAMVIRSTPVPVQDPEQPSRPEGAFSLLGGGTSWGKDAGRARIEVGFWPYQNIFWKSEKFKSERNHVGTELIRISW